MSTPSLSAVTAIDPRDWEEAIANIDGAQLVVGGPGTGKTEFLVRRTLHLLERERISPEDITIHRQLAALVALNLVHNRQPVSSDI